MRFKVCKIYGAGAEVIAGQFNTLQEANAYIDEHLPKEAALSEIIYRVYEWDDLIKERKSSEEKSTSSTQTESDNRSGHAPTPFNMRPAPLNTPHAWMKEDDSKKK